MGKYSSDSEHEKRSGKRSESHKSSRRRRSVSSSSTESRNKRGTRDKHSKRTRKSRSKSRDRYSRSRRSESSSRSSSRINSSSKYRSHRRSRSKSRSKDRDRDRDRRSRLRRSRSRSYIREFTSRPRRHSSSSSDSSSSDDSRRKSRKEKRSVKKDSTKSSGIGKVECLSLSEKPDKQESVAYNVQEEMPQFDSATLDEINNDGFAPKPFHSDKKPMENIVINLKDQTIKVPETDQPGEEATSLFHHNLFGSEESRMQKWVKELYVYRQKALQQGIRKK